MTATRPPHAPPRPTPPKPKTTKPPQPAAGQLFAPSTAGWYAEWKARRDAVAADPAQTPSPDAAAAPVPADDAAAAVARWLTGDAHPTA